MNEFELIKTVTHGAPAQKDGLVRGVGDDCAVISGNETKDFLITTDALFEDVHFKREWISPRTLGRKALSVNISDIAAMGGKPLFYLVTIGIPKAFPLKEVEEIFEGMANSAFVHRTALIGGDTCSSANGLLISITVIGDIDKGKSIYRSGAKIGDSVYVTGILGHAALGLACLEKGIRSLEVREFIRKHDDPTPRVAIGQWLMSSTCVSSMIDISDGLVSDLNHIAEASNVEIKIFANQIPKVEEFAKAANRCSKDALTLALTGGEDYELAFTVSSYKKDLFEKMMKVVAPTFGHAVTKIGEVTAGNGVKIIDMHGANMHLTKGGYEHKF
ncbi:MAG: thiamine-phosphate kinase [Deltaproteobacteria bacterium]|nr:thiamine-phosphate kinase [Deltaproteobacteria bacterium]